MTLATWLEHRIFTRPCRLAGGSMGAGKGIVGVYSELVMIKVGWTVTLMRM